MNLKINAGTVEYLCYGLCFYKLAITIFLGNTVLNFAFVFSSCIIS